MIINANALSIPLASRSVQCIVTSPPYWGLRNYGVAGQLGLERTPDEYVANMVAVFRECWRVLRDDGTLWLNLGDSYATDQKGGEKSHPGDKSYTNKGGLNINKFHPEHMLKDKDLVGIPWRVAFALQADGWYLRSDIIWSKPNPMPESVTDRPTKSHEYLFLLAKSQRYYYDADAVREELKPESIERWHGDVKPSLQKRNTNNVYPDSNAINTIHKIKSGDILNHSGRNRRTVWEIPTMPYKGAHFATFPTALVEPCIKAGTSERGACPKCGAPWVRVVEKTPPGKHESETYTIGSGRGNGADKSKHAEPSTSTTTGWRPSCDCYGVEIIEDKPTRSFRSEETYNYDMKKWYEKWERLQPIYDGLETVPCLVFDPFVGSGTTVQVAYNLGRRGVGLDLSMDYLEKQATTRIHNGHVGRLI